MSRYPLPITVSVGVALLAALAGCAGPRAGRDASAADLWPVLAHRKLVDLTHTFSPSTPVWAGFGQASFAPATNPGTGEAYTIAKHGARATQYTLVGQYGTHVDPPAHFSEGGRTLDELPVENLLLPLVVFDMTPKLRDDPNHALSVEDILAWERVHGRVPAGCFAALRTDMSKDWETNPERFERRPFPAWSLEAIRFLYEKRDVVATGHESMDTDATPEMKSETWLLRAGHWQVEMLANLDRVPATGAVIVVAWPKPKGGLGFPVRAFAILP